MHILENSSRCDGSRSYQNFSPFSLRVIEFTLDFMVFIENKIYRQLPAEKGSFQVKICTKIQKMFALYAHEYSSFCYLHKVAPSHSEISGTFSTQWPKPRLFPPIFFTKFSLSRTKFQIQPWFRRHIPKTALSLSGQAGKHQGGRGSCLVQPGRISESLETI